MIEQLRRVGKIMNIIFDALFICGIENDKIYPEVRTKFHLLVEQLAEQFPPEIKSKISEIKHTLSITQESLETLHQNIITVITNGLRELCMKGFEESGTFKELKAVIKQIIQHEKTHRDAEKEKYQY